MYLTHSNPWHLLDQLQQDFNHSRNGETGTSDWTPTVDIIEETSRFVIRADVPGVAPGDIDVHMEDGILTIEGQRQCESKQENASYKRVERVRGAFYRRFTMPDTADANNITARSEHGVLEVSIPKQERAQHRKILVDG